MMEYVSLRLRLVVSIKRTVCAICLEKNQCDMWKNQIILK